MDSSKDRLRRSSQRFMKLGALVVLLFIFNLIARAEVLPSTILLDALPYGILQDIGNSVPFELLLLQSSTALIAGAGLAIAGLLFQTLFQNPLADPAVLGVSSGANFGVIIMASFATISLTTSETTYMQQLILLLGALFITFPLLMLFHHLTTRIRNNALLVITGLMIGYIITSSVSLINTATTFDHSLLCKSWVAGDFSAVSMRHFPLLFMLVIITIGISIAYSKQLNTLLIGDYYAVNLGVSVKKVRIIMLICAGLLTASITTFCGLILFIGLVAPHVAKIVSQSANHKKLIPLSGLIGALMTLFCHLLSIIVPYGPIPINAITSLIGSPIILYLILNRRNKLFLN